MKKSRIVFLTSAIEMHSSYWRAFFLGKYLAQSGHEVSVIATSGKVTFRLERKMIDDVQVFLLPSFVDPHYNLFSYWLSRGLTVLTQTPLNCILEVVSDADILHSFDVMFPQNATPTLFSRLHDSLRIHCNRIFVDWDEWWGRGGLFNWFGGTYTVIEPLATFFEEKIPLYADAVTVLNEPLRQRAFLAGVNPEHLFVIPNGADVNFIKPLNKEQSRERLNLPKEKVICTTLGYVDKENLKLLLLTFSKIRRHLPGAVLLLVGLAKKQINFIESAAQKRNVICMERQPRSSIPFYLGASDVLLLPLRDSVTHRATWPLRLGDYLAAGRPIVATALPEIAKIVDNSGLLYKPNDPNDLADKISEVIRNANLREEMGKRAREIAEKKYAWPIVAKQLERVYDHYS